MKKNIKWLLFVGAIALTGCNSDCKYNEAVAPDPTTAGTANFAKYVALGNSLSAGFSDNALFIEGQKGSYTNIMSQQFAQVGGGEFRIPFMLDNIGGFNFGGSTVPGAGPRLIFNGAAPVPVAAIPSTPLGARLTTGPFNNMGVPGAKSFHLLSTSYGNQAGIGTTANPYFVRMSTSNTASIIGDAMAQAPTFFSLWIGNNDVLSYATTGGTGVNQTGNFNPATYGGNDITDPTVFNNVYTTLTNTLTSAGAKGVVSNIPYVTSVPFFTTVPTNPVPLTAAQIAPLNNLFGNLNSLFNFLGETTPRFVTLSSTSNNALLIVDETLTPRAAQITAALTPSFGPALAAAIGNIMSQARHARNTVGNSDYILLTTRGVIGQPANGADPNTTVTVPPAGPFNILGVSYPLVDRHVLTADETNQVKVATDAYNASILSIANTKGLAFVNSNAVLAQVATPMGFSANGFTITSAFVTGGGFSLDGVHPSPRGYALIANKFLEAINAKYGSNFTGVNLGNYRILYNSSI